MNNKSIKILAIESSCDETAAAIIGEEEKEPVILSNVISSQVDLHAKTGGVVPEVASRAHMESIVPVVLESLKDAGCELQDITHIAVTNGPGLIGSLLVGFNAAKSLAYAKDLPIVPVNHIEGHIYSAFSTVISTHPEPTAGWRVPLLSKERLGEVQESEGGEKSHHQPISFPLLALTVSGGHTSLTLMKDHGIYEQIGQTIDDAVGEAYDKVAKLLSLGYPGGPIISRLAQEFRNSTMTHGSIVFPRPIINDGTFNFSFSGLKTAVLQKVIELAKANSNQSDQSERIEGSRKLTEIQKQEIAYAFEEAVADVLVKKTILAAEKHHPKSVIFAGGVSANNYLKNRLSSGLKIQDLRLPLFVPPKEMTGDNAAMIGVAAYYHIKKDNVKNWNEVQVNSNLELCL